MNRLSLRRGSPDDGPTQGSTRRRAKWLAVIAAITLPVAIVTAPFALAGTTPPFTIGPPNAAVVPGADADQTLDDPQGNVKELGPLNSNTTKIGVIHNDVPDTLGLTNPNGQVDLRQAFLGTESDADGDDWIYFAWERDNNTGSGFISFEFMQEPPPAACGDYSGSQDDLIATCNPWANRDGDTDGAGPDIGDFMILWDQQGGSKDLFLRTWTGTAPNLTLGAPVLLNANVSDAEYSADGFFGEGAVNLTDTVFGGSNACRSFANVIPSTVTGNSDTADYKDTILQPVTPIGNCTTTTVTTPKDGAGANIPAGGLSITTAGVVQVKDSALIEIQGGTATPAGTIDFTLCKASNVGPPATATCDVGGPSVLVDDNKAVSDVDGAYPVTVVSSTAWITSAGRYCWKAVYSGDPDNGIGGSSDVSIGECFLVTPVTPVLDTVGGPDVTLGNAITDTATLSGTAPKPTAAVIHTSAPDPATRTPAGGTITFTLFGPSTGSCGPQIAAATQNAAVSGDRTSPLFYGPATFTPTAAGDYHWKASYTGDSPNTLSTSHNALCDDTDEDVTVTTVASSMTTAQTWVPRDSATISAPAGGPLAGTVSFALYASSDCAVGGDAAIYSTTRPVSGASPVTVSTVDSATQPAAQAATGSFSWSVAYDSTNPAQRDIPASCHETSALTITNGGTISSP